MGILYLVATPIGNLEDITVRAAKLLTEIAVVVCEDTRHSGILLEHLRNTYLQNPMLAKKPRLLSFYEQNEEEKIPEIIAILQRGQDVALVTDAGTPGISDPGFTLVRACVKEGIKVTGLPGASSAVLALSISGLPTDKFAFYGYLPKKTSHAKTLLENIKEGQQKVKTTAIFFEAPHKLISTLALIAEVFVDCEVVLCRELTKLHEEVIRGSLQTVQAIYEHKEPKGEYVILIH